ILNLFRCAVNSTPSGLILGVIIICLAGLSILMYSLNTSSSSEGLMLVVSCSGMDDIRLGGSSSLGPPIGELCLAQDITKIRKNKPSKGCIFMILIKQTKGWNSYLYPFFHVGWIYILSLKP